MKKTKMIILCSAIILNSSCATILRGAGTECQKTSPDRKARVGMILLDLMWVFPLNAAFLIIDAKTGALYKPCDTSK